MKRLAKLAGLALVAWSSIAAQAAGSDDDPAAYAVRVAVAPAAGSSVQRLPIPARILAAARSFTLRDLRVFDATGKAMPMARIAPAAAPVRRDVLPALPILGAVDSLKVTGVSLRLDGSGRARVAQVVGTVPTGPTAAALLGILLDARAIAGSAQSLAIDADLPVAQPVTVTVEASTDLTTWRPLGERVIYRATASGRDAAATPILLGDAAVRGDWLRVTWRTASRLLSPVAIRRATLATRPDAAAADSVVDAVVPPLTDRHAIEVALPFAAAISSIRVVPAGTDVIIPIRVLGRDDPEQPWTLLGQGTATRQRSGSATDRGIVLAGPAFRTLRIEADRASAGFTAAPAVGLGFARRDIAFLAIGRAPYVLAAGRGTATDAFLPLASVMTQAVDGRLATATTSPAGGAVRLEPVGAPGGRRQALLWLVLLGATAMLGAMAWLLWRRGAESSANGDG